jgi:hypothetical protein
MAVARRATRHSGSPTYPSRTLKEVNAARGQAIHNTAHCKDPPVPCTSCRPLCIDLSHFAQRSHIRRQDRFEYDHHRCIEPLAVAEKTRRIAYWREDPVILLCSWM